MNNTIKLIFGLLCVTFFIFIFSYNNFFEKIISKVKLTDYVKLSKSDLDNIYSFIESKYNNILLPREIIFKEKNNKFISEDFKFLSNNIEKTIDLEFKPFENNNYVSKHSLYNKYGEFKIIENIQNKEYVSDIKHLSSDSSDDLNSNDLNSNELNSNELNFDINDIIESDNEIFLQKTDKVDNNDTDNNTTESIINNIL